MERQAKKVCLILCLSVFAGFISFRERHTRDSGPVWRPSIPRTWDDQAIRSLEVQLADPSANPKHISADYYYRIPVRPIFRSYSIYRPDKEPDGYLDWLKQQEPEVVFDSAQLKTEEDWLKAGEIVFEAPTHFASDGTLFSRLRTLEWFTRNDVPIAKDGVFPFMRYVIREKGKLEVGFLACAMCHTRVMDDGSLLKGAQGNFPDDRTAGYEARLEASQSKNSTEVLQSLRRYMRKNYAAPWLRADPNAKTDKLSVDEIASLMEAIPPGVCARQGSSIF